jgi:beta-glucosidase
VESADRFHNHWFLDPLYLGEYTPGLFADLGVTPPPIKQDDMEIIAAATDFLGVNYYNRWIVRATAPTQHGGIRTPLSATVEYVTKPATALQTEMGWEVYPHGLTLLLEELARVYRPPTLLITENGAAFHDTWNGNGRVSDPLRVAYLRDHLGALGSALEQGVPVAGYFVWSLFDNYEWAEGYSKRFGLVYVDYPTQRRIVKDSGRWYAGFIAAQGALHGQ